MVKRGDQVELVIESAAYEGKTVARLDQLVVFVPFGVPGDRVRATIVKKRKRYAEAAIDTVLEPAIFRVTPVCRHFGTCGGCRLQNVAYEEQLRFKKEQVSDLFQRIGGITEVPLFPTIPSPRPYYYRNKMEFSFGSNRWLTAEEIAGGEKLDKGFALGLHIPGRFDKILDIHECHLQDEWTGDLVNFVRKFAREQKWSPYDTRQHTGFLRNLTVRSTTHGRETMVGLVTRTRLEEGVALLGEALRREFPAVTTFVNIIHPGRSPVPSEDEVEVVFGDGVIREWLDGVQFEITPSCFFQPNSMQAEQLFRVIEEFAQPAEGTLVYDLFCGTGAIGLFLARSAGRVVGVESHGESIRLARSNARLNGIENCSFHAGDALVALEPAFREANGDPDLIVLDPPRAGLHPKLVKRLQEQPARRLVYSSCNPATQARDLALLKQTYRIEKIQPVDMFPQTYHIENVVQLSG